MADGIEIRDGQASMFYVGEKPWHGLGTELKEPATAQEAIRAASLDWRVVKKPVYAGDEGKPKRPLANRFAVVPEHLWGKEEHGLPECRPEVSQCGE